MVKGTTINQRTMGRFELIMHVGGGKICSKTEFIFIPAVTNTRNIINDYIAENAIKSNTTRTLAAEESEKSRLMTEN